VTATYGTFSTLIEGTFIKHKSIIIPNSIPIIYQLQYNMYSIII
jgi:hypothetical protein